MRWVAVLTMLVVVLSVWSSPAVERTHASGIALLPPLDIGPFARERERMGEDAFAPIAIAYQDARQLAEAEPELYGVPWMDLAHRSVVVRVTSPVAAGQVRHPTSAPIRIESTTRSFGLLRSIMDGSIDEPGLGIRGGPSRVWTISIDDESQRVVFESDRVVDSFLYALARRYGPDVVALRVDPRSGAFCALPLPLDPSAKPAGDPCGRETALPFLNESDHRKTYAIAFGAAAIAMLLVAVALLARGIRRPSG